MVVVAACFATVAVAATDVVVADSAVVNGDSTVEVIATAGLVVVAATPVDVVVVVVAAAVDIFVVVGDGDTLDASFIFGAKAKWQKFFRSDAGAASGKRPMPSGYLDGRWERKIKVEKKLFGGRTGKKCFIL